MTFDGRMDCMEKSEEKKRLNFHVCVFSCHHSVLVSSPFVIDGVIRYNTIVIIRYTAVCYNHTLCCL